MDSIRFGNCQGNDVSVSVARKLAPEWKQSGVMPRKIPAPKFPSPLFHARAFRKLSQDQLSAKSGVLKGTISKLERLPKGGGMELTVEWAKKFTRALDLSAKEIMFFDPKNPPGQDDHIDSQQVANSTEPSPKKNLVKLKGYVGAGSEAHYYRYADEDFDWVEPPGDASDQTVAVVIKGKSWGPRMDGWLVFYDDVRSPITEDMINQPCVVGLADDRILLKTIKRERDGSFTLLSNSDEPAIENAEIEWGAKVIGMRPR
jgi:transcriptional regulator with XRE-family HTH domain